MIGLSINIDASASAWKSAFPRLRQKIEQAAALAFTRAKKPLAFKGRHFEVNILLTTDAAVKSLNHDYRGKNKPTNVLSFPQFDMHSFRKSHLESFPQKMTLPLGDVVLAHQTIRRECREQSKDIESHTIHLVIHGTLHLLGYDHMRLKDAKIMERLECDILATLGYSDPYHETKAKNGRRSRHG